MTRTERGSAWRANDDPWGRERIRFSATTKLQRREFGLTYGIPLVADEVKVTLHIEAIRQSAGS